MNEYDIWINNAYYYALYIIIYLLYVIYLLLLFNVVCCDSNNIDIIRRSHLYDIIKILNYNN